VYVWMRPHEKVRRPCPKEVVLQLQGPRPFTLDKSQALKILRAWALKARFGFTCVRTIHFFNTTISSTMQTPGVKSRWVVTANVNVARDPRFLNRLAQYAQAMSPLVPVNTPTSQILALGLVMASYARVWACLVPPPRPRLSLFSGHVCVHRRTAT